jgi:hypothetical protein
MSDETKALMWSLAFGSNMNRGIFEDRRGMRPIHAQPARLENYRLRFNLAIGPGERGVANLESQAGARIWGVLYLIAVEQSKHLDLWKASQGACTAALQFAPSSMAVSR